MCKNLLLGGIGAVTIRDATMVSQRDLRANFFFAPEDVGKNVRAKIAAARCSKKMAEN